MTKPIRLSGHAHTQLARRGVTEEEVVAAIRSSPWQSADLSRLECRNNFKHASQWNGKFYETKQVRPIFVEEDDEILVVTIYSYYF